MLESTLSKEIPVILLEFVGSTSVVPLVIHHIYMLIYLYVYIYIYIYHNLYFISQRCAIILYIARKEKENHC